MFYRKVCRGRMSFTSSAPPSLTPIRPTRGSRRTAPAPTSVLRSLQFKFSLEPLALFILR